MTPPPPRAVGSIDHEASDESEITTGGGSSRGNPGWITVFLIVVALSIVALPRTVTSAALFPILLFGGAVVLVMRRFL
jgi:hypothetical protein